MLRPRSASRALAVIAFILGAGPAGAESGAPAAPSVGIAIADFTYADTSGEATDQTAAHRRRLQAFMAALRRDFAADGRFRLVPVACGPAPCAADDAELLRAAADAGATILVIGGIHKQSTLIQWAKVDAIDIAADRVLLDRLFTFRGDNDEAWDRAEAFVFSEISAVPATPGEERRP